MNRLAISTALGALLAAATLYFAGPAAADPFGGSSAADTVQTLQDRGYDVQINGDQNAPLAECTVTNVSGLAGSEANGQTGVPAGTTVYVGVSCDDDHDE